MTYRLIKASILILLISCTISFSATEKGFLSALILDAKSKQSISGATLRLEESPLGAVSNNKGKVFLKGIKPGRYKALVSIMGYETQRLDLTIKTNDTLFITIYMAEKAFQTEEVVVSANKRVQAVQDVPVSISVIDKRSLEQRQITLIDQALRYLPGVNLNGDNVSIRGSSGFAFGVGSRVAFLMDGFPLLSGDVGDIKFDAMPVFNIDRIEVVKGSGSALYGSSALGGVVNIIMAQPQDKAEFKIRAGTGIFTKTKYPQWNYQGKLSLQSSVDVGYSQKFNGLGVIFSISGKKDDSYKKYDDATKYNSFGRVNYTFSDKADLSLTGSFSNDDHADWVYWNRLDSATKPPTDTKLNIRFVSKKATGIASFRYIFSSTDFLIARTGIFSTKMQTNTHPSDTGYRSSIANTINSEIQSNNKLFDWLLITSGLNHTFNTIESNLFGNRSQNILAVYTQLESSINDRLTVTSGGRLDYEKVVKEKENLQFSPKIGLSYSLQADTKLRMSVGRGFRAPMVGERFVTVPYKGYTVIPNPDLKPEYSSSAEIGINHETNIFGNDFHLDFSIFDNEYYNLIEALVVPRINPTDSIKLQFNNVTRARIIGTEIDIKTYLFGLIGFETSVTAMYPRDLTLDETLKYRSMILWYSRLIIPIGPAEIQGEYRFISRVETIDLLLGFGGNGIQDVDARVPIHVVDARVIFDMKKIFDIPMKLGFNVKNLFNYYYSEYPGNLAPTRFIGVQADYSY